MGVFVLLFLLIRVSIVAAASASILSALGNDNGIDGIISISGVEPYATISNSRCFIFSSASPETPTQVPSHGGLTDFIPLSSLANNQYKFSCYFDGPSQAGSYYADIVVWLHPSNLTDAIVGAATGMLPAGGGVGVPPSTATISSQTLAPYSQESTTYTLYMVHTSTPIIPSTPSLQMPEPPQPTTIQSTSNTPQLALTLTVIAAVIIGGLYSRRKPKLTKAEKVDSKT